MKGNDGTHLIYHYASLETFSKIISNKTLRLSDITKSNDRAEITWIKRYIQDVFRRAYSEDKTEDFARIISRDYWERLTEFFTAKTFDVEYRQFSYYVCCFSGDGDRLSQWRGYADDGKGVAIGYDANVLNDIIRNGLNGLKLCPVIYDVKEQQSIVHNVAEDLMRKILSDEEKGIIKPACQGEGRNGSGFSAELMRDFDDAFYTLFEHAIMMKNPFFEEEDETRVYYMLPNRSILNESYRSMPEWKQVLHYDVKKAGISSYIDIPLDSFFKDAEAPLIRSVCIGPKCNARREELQDLLEQYDIPTQMCQLKYSEGTYR